MEVRTPDISDEEYHAHPAISQSKLKVYKDSPKRYYHEIVTGRWREDLMAIRHVRLGTALGIVCQNDIDFDRVAVLPYGATRRKDTKAYKMVVNDHPGKLIITDSDFEDLKWMVEELHGNQRIRNYLWESGGQWEKSVFWKEDGDEMERRCKFDVLLPNIIIDLKATVSVKPHKFSSTMWDFGYPNQQAWYQRGAAAMDGTDKLRAFVFVAVEYNRPYESDIVEVAPAEAAKAWFENETLFQRLCESHRTDTWRKPGDGVIKTFSEPGSSKHKRRWEYKHG